MNAKMKVLSLAMVGLCGFAGTAMAACPAGPTTGEGGAWSAKSISNGSSFAIEAGGLEPVSPSACKATAALAGSLTAFATVTDNTPANEPSYRFQFLVDPSQFGNFSLTDWVSVFRANSAAGANGSSNLLTVTLVAGSGGAKRVRFNAACNTAPSYRCSQATTTDLPAGVVRIEGKLVTGASGTGKLTYWINAAQGTTEPAATGSIDVDNAAWVGVKTALLGLSGPSSSFKNGHAAPQSASFDAFDSRRQTYIGW